MIKNASIRHTVYQQRYGSGVVRKIMTLLNKSDENLVAKIESRLSKLADTGFDTGAATTARLQRLLDDVRALNKDAYAELRKELTDELKAFGKYEVGFHANMISSFLPVGVDLTVPPLALISASVTSQPLQGRLLKEWVDGLGTARFNRLRDTIRVGLVEGQTTNDIVRNIRGTKAANYADGVMEIDRRGAEALVRTAVNFVGAEARDAVFEENGDIVDEWEWVSTLDNATCLECADLDGQTFALGEGPSQPAHIGCRCTKSPVLKGKLRELQLAVSGTRASKGSDGSTAVSGNLTYGEWLGKQSASFQDEALGADRAALFRRGGLSIDKFTDRAGNTLTLDALRDKEPSAFRKANV